MDLNQMQVSEAKAPTEEEMLQEARARGFSSIEEMMQDMDEAMEQADKDARSLHESGVIT